MVTPEDIKGWIQAGLDGARVEIDGDGRHFSAVVVYADFAGKSMVEQHQMVYGTLGERMKEQVHALSLRTLTPQEAAGRAI